MLPDGLVGNYAANCVQDFGDGMANAEVELNLKPQVSCAASVIILWSVDNYLVRHFQGCSYK